MELKGDKYCIQGIDMMELAEAYGLPLYVYDTQVIRRQFDRLISAFNVGDLRINYACKALTNISILRFIRSLGAGADTVSPEEMQICLRAGFSPDQIFFTPSSVAASEYEEAMDLGIRINIDSLETLQYFADLQISYPICIRINPHILAGGNRKISTGHEDSKFGISIKYLQEIIATVLKGKLNVEGLHMHTGSDILDIGLFLQATDILFEAAGHFPYLRYLDFGSGFKVKYKDDDKETDLETFGNRLSEKFNIFCDKRGTRLQMMFEPGKFLVSESGIFLANVNIVKKTPNRIFAGLNTGLNHLIRPMFYEAYHEITNISNPHGERQIYSVVGYICETDTFAWDRPIAQLQAGNVVAFHNAGAYAFQMASNYNSRLRPAEVMIHAGSHYLIRKRETLDDLLRNQPDLII